MNKIIMYDDPDIVVHRNDISGWMAVESREFFGDSPGSEDAARHCTCTHVRCAKCGEPVEKYYKICKKCQKDEEMERYLAMPFIEMKDDTVTCLADSDVFFMSRRDIEDYADDKEIPAGNLPLIVCVPVYAKEIDPDEYYIDDLPDDYSISDIDQGLYDAFQELNKYINERKTILGWRPGTQRTRYEPCRQQAVDSSLSSAHQDGSLSSAHQDGSLSSAHQDGSLT